MENTIYFCGYHGVGNGMLPIISCQFHPAWRNLLIKYINIQRVSILMKTTQMNLPVDKSDHDLFKLEAMKQSKSMKALFHDWIKKFLGGKK